MNMYSTYTSEGVCVPECDVLPRSKKTHVYRIQQNRSYYFKFMCANLRVAFNSAALHQEVLRNMYKGRSAWFLHEITKPS